MKVYIVLGSTYEYNPDSAFGEVVRVYSSKKCAEQFVEKYKEAWDELQIIQHEVEKTFGG